MNFYSVRQRRKLIHPVSYMLAWIPFTISHPVFIHLPSLGDGTGLGRTLLRLFLLITTSTTAGHWATMSKEEDLDSYRQAGM